MTPPKILGEARRRRLLALLIGMGLLQAALAIVGAFAMGRFLKADTLEAAYYDLGLLAVCGLVALFLHAQGRAVAERFGQSYVAVCRTRLLKAIVRNGGETHRHGIAMTRLITDLSSIKNWVARGIALGATNGATLLGLVIGSFFLAQSVLFAICLSLAIGIVLILAVMGTLNRSIREARAVRGALAARVGEAVLTAPSLRTFGTLDKEKRKIYRVANRLADKLAMRYRLATLLRHSPELGFLAGFALLGIVELRAESSDVGGAATGILLLATVATAQRGIAQSLDLWLNYAEARRRLTEALKEAGPAANVWRKPGPLGISCRDTDLAGEGLPASFEIAAGERVALPAGKAAAGLFRNIAGITQPEQGKVALVDSSGNRFDAGVTALAALLVSPEIPLRRGTISFNLQQGTRKASQERIEKIARLCGLNEDMEGTPVLEKQVGEAGRGLPALLAARVRLARAVMARPGVLLIDDPIFEIEPQAQAVLSQVVEAEKMTVLVLVHGDAAPIPVHRWVGCSLEAPAPVTTEDGVVMPFRKPPS